MQEFDLVIRHSPEDDALATRLAGALDAFGYSARLASAPETYRGTPWVVIFSPVSVNDDEFLFECAEAAQLSGKEHGTDQVFQVVAGIHPLVVELPEYGRSLPSAPRRSSPYSATDLTRWSGDPSDGNLAMLIRELPPPSRRIEHPPIQLPQGKGDAEWKTARWLASYASGNLAEMGYWLTMSGADSPDNDGFASAEFLDRVAQLRVSAQKPESWTRFGPGAVEAFAKGPAALHAWGERVKRLFALPDTDNDREALGRGSSEGLCFAIQVTVGDDFKPLTQRDHRPKEYFLRAAEKGDEAALMRLGYRKEHAPMLERLAEAGNPAAMYLVAHESSTPQQRQRSLLERAAAAGHVESCNALARRSEDDGDMKRHAEWLRRGAELGDRWCKIAYAACMDKGEGVPRDAAGAYALLQETSLAGDIYVLRIAQMLWDGDGVARDREAAVRRFFFLALVGGYWEPDIHIGDLYAKGLGGLRQDRDEAISWYKVGLNANNNPVVQIVAAERLRQLKALPKDTEIVPINDLGPDERRQIKRFWAPRR
jgi:TPR repeat protein